MYFGRLPIMNAQRNWIKCLDGRYAEHFFLNFIFRLCFKFWIKKLCGHVWELTRHPISKQLQVHTTITTHILFAFEQNFMISKISKNCEVYKSLMLYQNTSCTKGLTEVIINTSTLKTALPLITEFRRDEERWRELCKIRPKCTITLDLSSCKPCRQNRGSISLVKRIYPKSNHKKSAYEVDS